MLEAYGNYKGKFWRDFHIFTLPNSSQLKYIEAELIDNFKLYSTPHNRLYSMATKFLEYRNWFKGTDQSPLTKGTIKKTFLLRASCQNQQTNPRSEGNWKSSTGILKENKKTSCYIYIRVICCTNRMWKLSPFFCIISEIKVILNTKYKKNFDKRKVEFDSFAPSYCQAHFAWNALKLASLPNKAVGVYSHSWFISFLLTRFGSYKRHKKVNIKRDI